MDYPIKIGQVILDEATRLLLCGLSKQLDNCIAYPTERSRPVTLAVYNSRICLGGRVIPAMCKRIISNRYPEQIHLPGQRGTVGEQRIDHFLAVHASRP